MSDLIVDFPQQHRNSPVVGKRVEKSVHFAAMTETRCFKRHYTTDTGVLWFSDGEYRAMKIANQRAVESVYRRYLALSTSNIETKDEVLGLSGSPCTTGLENLLTPGLTKKAKAVRVRRLNAVLDEQERQDKEGEHDPFELAYVSSQHSKWSRKRAITVGLLQQDKR